MKAIGIDPGFGRCGYAVLTQGSSLVISDLGVMQTAAKISFPERLQEIANNFDSLLDTHRPDVVAIEDLFFGQNITTGLKVSAVRGVLIYLSIQKNIVIAEPKPVEVKKSFCGDGHADKIQMRQMATLHFPVLKKAKIIDDAIDALAIAYAALSISQSHDEI